MSERKDIHNSEIPILCRACEARHRGVCGALTPDQLTHLSKHTIRGAVAPDGELVAAEEPIERYSNIISGVVKLTKLMADGRQQIVGLQFAPNFLGRPFQRDAKVSAEAANSVSLCSFPKNVLDGLLKQSPDLEHRLHEQALRELDEAHDLMLLLGRKTAAEKVASYLLMLIRHIDPEAEFGDRDVALELPMRRVDIADFLGLTIETVSRQLTKLRKSGIITIENNRQIRVPSLARLEQASGN